jgi:hypothetical protein
VTFRSSGGVKREDSFPVQVEDYSTANLVAVSYVLQVLRLEDFELRIAGT